MSYYKVKYVSIKKDGATVTLADNSLRPIEYRRISIMEGKSKEEIMKTIINNIRYGNYYVEKSQCKLLNKIEEAGEFLKDNKLSRILMDNDYITFVINYIEDKNSAIKSLRDKKNFFLSQEYAKKTLWESADRWKYLPPELRNDVPLAKYYVENCSDGYFFTFPTCLLEDRDMVLYSVRKHGVNYRQVYKVWGNDKEITLEAFSAPTPEHLPDLIGEILQKDLSFLKKIIIAEPKLHWERFPQYILAIPQVKEWLYIYNVWYRSAVDKKKIA